MHMFCSSQFFLILSLPPTLSLSISISLSISLYLTQAGVHRVQRVPITDGAGKVQTSTATVAVMPEVNLDPSVRNSIIFYRNRSRNISDNLFACFFLSQSFFLNFSSYNFLFIFTTIGTKVDDVEIVINMDEVEMKTARSSGAGKYSIIHLYLMIRLYLQTYIYNIYGHIDVQKCSI